MKRQFRMFMEIGAPHHRPHFHAAYQETKVVFALLQDWALLQSGKPPVKIEPLR